jgi:hypothetical protein
MQARTREAGSDGPSKKKKAPFITGLSSSEADGTRTRNHRIDSPVL